MALQQDGNTGLFKFFKFLPHNGFGIWVLQHLSRAPSAKLPDTYESRWEEIPERDGGTVRCLIVAPKAPNGPLPLMVHFHGGGYVGGTPQAHSLDRIVNFITVQDAVFVCPQYTLAVDKPFPAGHDDCYDTLLWAAENAEVLGGRRDQIIIGGESAGGGMTLGIALRARDEGQVNIAFQCPIYPMADDREDNWTKLPEKDVSWTFKFNQFGWDKWLGGKRGSADVSPYAAPSRATDLRGLPPALTFIGTDDIFLEETRDIVRRMQDAGVEVDYREFENAYHGQEDFAPNSVLGKEIHAHYRDRFVAFVGKYTAAQPADLAAE